MTANHAGTVLPPCTSDPDLFFEDEWEELARSYCQPCPRREWCRDTARENRELHGVWGGETAAERLMWALAQNDEKEPTDEEIALVMKWYRSNDKQAGLETNQLTRIAGRMSRDLGIPYPKIREAVKRVHLNEVAELMADGAGVDRISEVYGISKRQARKWVMWVQRAGLAPVKSKGTT